MVREGRVFVSSASRPAFGGSYYVHALKPGAQVASASSGTTVTVRAGHGFSANDKLIVGTDSTLFRTVSVAGATSLTIDSALTVAQGDILVNLGADTGITGPLYDGNGVTIYSDMDYSNAVTNQRVTTDSNGRYRYFHRGVSLWELVRNSSGTVIASYQDIPNDSSTVFNVRDWGATGDGTTDDVVAIQNALSAVPSTGGAVYLPAGTYMVSVCPFIKSNTRVYGDGIGVSTIKRMANTYLALGSTQVYNSVLSCGPSAGSWYTTSSPGSNITVSDLTIDGNQANQTHTGTQHYAYGFSTSADPSNGRDGSVDGLTLRGVQVINSMETGIRINTCRNVLVDGCQVDTCGQDDSGAFALNGIDFNCTSSADYSAGWNQRIVCSNNRIRFITPTSSSMSGEGIAYLNAGDLTIIGNDISYADYGIEGNGSVMGNITICGNTIHNLSGRGNGGVGITIVPSTIPTTTASVAISGNTFHDVGGNAVNIGYCGQVSVGSNTIYKCNTTTIANQNFAVDLYQCTYGAVVGNTIVFSSPTTSIRGIRIFTGSGLVSGNTVNGPTSECITLNGGTSNTLVTGNRLIGGTYGVLISNSGTNASNIVFNNSYSGQSSGETSDSSGQTNYIDNLNNLTVRGALAATGTFKVGAGTDANVDITFDQGTGTDPILRWYDAGDNFRFVTASKTFDIPNRDGTAVSRSVSVDATGQSANIGSTNALTVPTSGRYRVSGYVVVTQAATTSSTMPKIRIGWQDADSNTAIPSLDLTATNAGNTVGTTYAYGSAVVSARATNTIAYDTTGYASSGATSMQYAVHLLIEAI